MKLGKIKKEGNGKGVVKKHNKKTGREDRGRTGTRQVLPEPLGTLGAEWGGFPRGRGSW